MSESTAPPSGPAPSEELSAERHPLLDAWVRTMLRHRFPVLAGVVALTLLFGWIAGKLPIVTAMRDMLPNDRPEFVGYDAARERFGGDETVLLGMVADDHFTDAGLERLERLTRLLGDHPLVERTTSLTNADQMWIDPDDPQNPEDAAELRIEPYLRPGATPASIRDAVLDDPIAGGTLVSEDGRLAVVIAHLVPSDEASSEIPHVRAELERLAASLPGGAAGLAREGGGRQTLEAAKQAVAHELVDLATEAGYAPDQVHATGFPVIIGSLVTEARFHLRTLFPGSMAVTFAVLVVLLRRPVDAILPLLCVLPAIIWAMALGGLIFGRISLVSSAAPIMVLVVGVSDVVHLVTQFRHELGRGHPRDEAIRLAFDQVGVACWLTSLTTFIGFGAIILLPLPYSRELGVYAAVGVVSAFLLSFILTPILLSFTHPRPGPEHSDEGRWLARGLRRLAGGIQARPRLWASVGLLATVVTAVSSLGIRVENMLGKKLEEGHPVRAAIEVLEDHVGAAFEFELLVDVGEDDGAKRPDLLAALDRIASYAKAEPEVHDADSYVDLLVRMHDLLGGAGPLPDSRALAAQYLLLLELSGTDDLATMLHADLRHARMVVRLPDNAAEPVVAAAARIEHFANQALPPGASAQANGLGLLMGRAGPEILQSSLRGIGTAFVLIAIVMGFRFRSVRVALLSIIPNLMPVAFGALMVHLLMGQVDADTMVYLMICVGIAVDDTIHFLARYGLERETGFDRTEAVSRAVQEAGHGILRTSIILMAGFGVAYGSRFAAFQMMGIMFPATLLAAVVLDLTFLPAMAHLGWFDPPEPRDGATGTPGPGPTR